MRGTWQTMDSGGLGYSYVMAAANLESPTATTATQTAWVPSGGGMTGQSAVGHLDGTAGTVLQPVDASLDVVGTQATATAPAPAPASGP